MGKIQIGSAMHNQEEMRINDPRDIDVPPWRKWGAYVSDRSWGTVREDYSATGDAWNYFPHEKASYKTYRWGEDAIAGWCDRFQFLVFAPVFWNGRDPILKERLFGLNSAEGNHGEDVKEYYFYLDGAPTHSYLKFLYKYPHAAYPYQRLIDENRSRRLNEPEFELLDTGIFDEDRYFDIFVEYAKQSEEDVCIHIEAINRGKVSAPLHIIPHLWFRNQWAWGNSRLPSPIITKVKDDDEGVAIEANDEPLPSPTVLPFEYRIGKRYLYGPKPQEVLFTDNETNIQVSEPNLPHEISRGGKQSYYKDGFHQKIVNGRDTTNSRGGTKACLHYVFEDVPAGDSVHLYLRFTNEKLKDPLVGIQQVIEKRKQETDEFYEKIHPKNATDEEKMIQRQALAGLIWSRQFYYFDVDVWLRGDNTFVTPPESRQKIRNIHWQHLNSMRLLSVPDKWEYPWFAAWDHAFHCLSLSLVDMPIAKEQLWLLLFDQFQHPNGQIPAYEWEFSDLNPPVHAWAALLLYEKDKQKNQKGDHAFLEKCFHRLIINFSFWVNKIDRAGSNVFEGGFLGLDNITVFDRSQKLEGGAYLEQSDGTGWMAMFSLNLMKMAIELAREAPSYEQLAIKFFQHFVHIASAMKKRDMKEYDLWSEEDGFFYDVLVFPDGHYERFRVRSLVGIIPLFATEVLDEKTINMFPQFKKSFDWFLKNRKKLTKNIVIPIEKNNEKKFLLTVTPEDHLEKVLEYVWNPTEFRSEFGLRSLSKFHEKHPFVFKHNQVSYEPAESLQRLKGGNSNWRGPIWMPTTYLLIESLLKMSEVYDLHVRIGGEKPVNLKTIATAFANGLMSIYYRDANGKRPVYADRKLFQDDPHWRDHLLFFEYFNGDTGEGLGASHQTGWTGLLANLIDEFRN